AAIHKILEAITDYHIYGIQTTLPLGNFVFQNSSFKDGNYDTHFLQKNYSPEVMKKSLWPKVEAAAFAIALERLKFINKPQENMVSEAWRKARR
ncbi:MAG: hypothetical protein KDC53_23895, partial [Saprospiraceae bacterium]|nr:hypothetical protein [Saprospiraceae bacterium]